jgi:hypothetical protein
MLAALISVKVFLLPLGVWMLVTRRWRALAWACAGTLTLNLLSWAILGFDQISVYLHVLRAFAGTAGLWGYSLIGLMRHLGASPPAADAVGLAAGAAVVLAGLRSVAPRRDTTMLTATIAACLLVSPVVESHYLALLLIPVALTAPVLSWRWFLPVGLFLVPADHPAMWQHVFSLVLTLILLVACMRSQPVRGRALSHLVPGSA